MLSAWSIRTFQEEPLSTVAPLHRCTGATFVNNPYLIKLFEKVYRVYLGGVSVAHVDSTIQKIQSGNLVPAILTLI